MAKQDIKIVGMKEVLRGLDGGETVVAKGSFYLKSILLREEIGDEH